MEVTTRIIKKEKWFKSRLFWGSGTGGGKSGIERLLLSMLRLSVLLSYFFHVCALI